MPRNKRTRNVRLHFTPEEYQLMEKYQATLSHSGVYLNMSKMCKQLVAYAVSDSRRRAQEMATQAALDAAQEKADGIAAGQVTTGNTTDVPASQDVNSPVLAEQAAGGDTPAGQ